MPCWLEAVSVAGIRALPLHSSPPRRRRSSSPSKVVAMVKSSWTKLQAVTAVTIGFCAIASLFDYRPNIFRFLRRARQRDELARARVAFETVDDDPRNDNNLDLYAVYPWAERNIHPLSAMPDASSDKTVLFWHIPKSAGATTKHIYKCLGRTVGVKSRPIDVLNSKKTGLVSSGKVDVIFSSSPSFSIEHLFDPSRKARVFALFRHPVHRLVSKFYYLQIASWEKSYRPAWKDMDVLHWAESHNGDNNFMVKQLAGKYQATEEDLVRAKITIRERFVVGLVDDMEESIRRFNTVMGINDETEKKHKRCMKQYFIPTHLKKNANPHPQVEEGSPAWDVLAEKNALDIQLYEYVLELFGEQKDVIDSYASPVAASPA